MTATTPGHAVQPQSRSLLNKAFTRPGLGYQAAWLPPEQLRSPWAPCRLAQRSTSTAASPGPRREQHLLPRLLGHLARQRDPVRRTAELHRDWRRPGLDQGQDTSSPSAAFLFIKDNRTFGAYEEAVDAWCRAVQGRSQELRRRRHWGTSTWPSIPRARIPAFGTATGAYILTPACEIQLPAPRPTSRAPTVTRMDRRMPPIPTRSRPVDPQPRAALGDLRAAALAKARLRRQLFFGTGNDHLGPDPQRQIKTRETAPGRTALEPEQEAVRSQDRLCLRPVGNGKTSIRGGFGLSYERNFNNVTFNVIQNPPNYGVVAFTTATPADHSFPSAPTTSPPSAPVPASRSCPT